ncbi:MAG: hypothetical protein ACK5KR_05995 [Breznakia sp.]
MKKLSSIALVFMIAVLAGCSSSKASTDVQVSEKSNAKKQEQEVVYTNYTDDLDLSNAETIEGVASWPVDISDVAKLRDEASNVFIGTVDSIDGCSTIAAKKEFNSFPQSYGKITVLKNLKGDTEDTIINFTRSGGSLTIAEYEKYAPAEIIESDDQNREAMGKGNVDKETTYLTYSYMDDITLEAGKTYLFFAGYVKTTNSYIIGGLQYGSRELYQEETKKSVFRTMPDVDTIGVKNNISGEYESLADLIEQYFSEKKK